MGMQILSINFIRRSKNSSSIDFSLDEFVEFLPGNSLSTVSSNWMNDLHKLLLGVAVFELLADVSQIVKVQFTFSLDVQQWEVSFSSLFAEGASLNTNKFTILAVSYLRNCSKSRGAPLVPS